MKKTLAFLAFTCFIQNAFAQNQYWSQQYGGEATLRGGTAVVGVNDNSCFFYNPATALIVDTYNITASTYVAGLESRELVNGAGSKVDLRSSNIYILPQVLSVSIPVRKAPRLKLILGTLTRYSTTINFEQENQLNSNVIAGSPGPQYYQGQVQYNNNSAEQWVGLSAAYKISQIFSVGATAFTSYTHLQVNDAEDLTVDAFSSGSPYSASVNVNNAMIINQFNEIFKLGATARFNNVHLGVAVTMPGLKIFGSGYLSKSFEVYNLNQNAADTTIAAQKHASYIISNVQNGLQSNYKQPVSVSAGVELLYPKFKISVAAEFFAGSRSKTIIQGSNNAYLRPTPSYGNDTINGFMSLQTSAVPVLNVGIGAEIYLKRSVKLLTGFRTDFNNRAEYLPNDALLKVAPISSPMWSYLYFSGGISYKLSRHEVIIGFDDGVGIPSNSQQVFNISEPSQNLFLNGNLNRGMKTHVNKINIILSWTYFFKSTRKKKSEELSFSDFFPPPLPAKHKKASHSPKATTGQKVDSITIIK